MSKLKDIFKDCRIVGLAGIKNSGKSNNLASLIIDFRKENKKVPIYIYGMSDTVMDVLPNTKEISSLSQLVYKRNCILILDEFQRLKLNDRRHKDALDEFIDYVYHNNVYVILSTPNIREFNTIIGGVIEKWLLKNIRIDQCINGSQLKKAVEDYKGRCKSLGNIDVPKNKLLVINDEEEQLIECEYIVGADEKLSNKEIF